MKKTLLLFFVALVATYSQAQERVVKDINFGWKFKAGEVNGAQTANLDDSQWRIVNLPHDFQIEQPWVEPDPSERPDNTDVAANIKSRLSSRGFKEMGKAWYRYHFTPGEELRDKRVLIDFAGIMYVGDVFVNGQAAGSTNYGYVGFEADITQLLKQGQDNVIAVLADTRDPLNSRWYTGGGLFRGVKIVGTAKDLYLERHPLYITTSDNRFVNVSATFTNRNKDPKTTLQLKIYAPDGQLVHEQSTTMGRHPQTRTQDAHFETAEIEHPQVWDTETPNLYTAEVTLIRPDGTIADRVSEHFGIRTVEFGPTFGMKLNGRKVLLKGYANHHTLGALGAANYPRAIEKRILLMKEFGINHIRTSHNPYSREFIELCDKYGILVVDELYDKWTQQHTGGRVPWQYLWQNDVPEWVKRDRNSPSVVLWSLGNELQQDPNIPFSDWGVTAFKLQKTLLQRYDSTRLVTVAMHPRYRNWQTDSLPADLAMATDIQAYNYRYMYFPGDGRRFPWMTFYQSEASIAAMGQNFFAMDLQKVIGLAYWGAIDYLGESQGWPNKGWAQGVFDIDLQPKPKAWFMRSFFKPDEPLVHIAVIDSKGDMQWNGIQTGNDGMSDHWDRQPGQTLNLITYTNADEVELLLNGKSLGRKANAKDDDAQRNQIKWNNIVYQPGKLEAVARNNGVVVARHKIETTGKAVRLVATADNDHWQADGMDLQHVRITAVDAKGRRVFNVQDELLFDVEGDATIVAVSNGDIASSELHTGNRRSLYNGTATVILRSSQKPSEIILTTSSDKFKKLKTKLSTK